MKSSIVVGFCSVLFFVGTLGLFLVRKVSFWFTDSTPDPDDLPDESPSPVVGYVGPKSLGQMGFRDQVRFLVSLRAPRAPP